MNFYTEVKPVIEKYMNKAFRAYDGYGAEIVFPNDVSVNWEINEDSTVRKVTLQSKNYILHRTKEESLRDILNIVVFLAESELDYQQMRKKVNEQYTATIKDLLIKL